MTVAKVYLMVRANDPLYELSFKIYISRMEDKIWSYTLRQVAAHFGVTRPEVDQSVALIDKRRQWNQMSNLWKNSAVRTPVPPRQVAGQSAVESPPPLVTGRNVGDPEQQPCYLSRVDLSADRRVRDAFARCHSDSGIRPGTR